MIEIEPLPAGDDDEPVPERKEGEKLVNPWLQPDVWRAVQNGAEFVDELPGQQPKP